MTTVLLFHSVLGPRAGTDDAVARLRAAGHDVLAPDYLEGHRFDEYDPAIEYSDGLGMAEFQRRALAAADTLPQDAAVMGFSQGGMLAMMVALNRPVSRVVLEGAALPPSEFGAPWPERVTAQVHQTLGDPFRDEGWAERMRDELAAAGAECEVYDYPGEGHLFTDPSLTAEYDAEATELFWSRVLTFLE